MSEGYTQLVLDAFRTVTKDNCEAVDRRVKHNLLLVWVLCACRKSKVRAFPTSLAMLIWKFFGDVMDALPPTASVMSCVTEQTLKKERARLKCVLEIGLATILREQVMPEAKVGNSSANIIIPQSFFERLLEFSARVREETCAWVMVRRQLNDWEYVIQNSRNRQAGWPCDIEVTLSW
eukprot:TRINITY_DN58051_c0_g1_i1.p1 TRINITY_DN58051_c0_g1~~TRINITY_DN58051_c0_g1_i1.p1  ORF type:complete len:178 (+),score=30.69 TRINITY_DN58051_c0_g1_i1:79-612(+)